MISKETTYQGNSLSKTVVTAVMIFLLLFLTTANFFFFQDDSKSSYSNVANQGDDPEGFPNSPTGPDEKAPGGPVSFSEEFIHGHLEISDFFRSNRLFTHLITASEKIELVHFELLSPPPKC